MMHWISGYCKWCWSKIEAYTMGSLVDESGRLVQASRDRMMGRHDGGGPLIQFELT